MKMSVSTDSFNTLHFMQSKLSVYACAVSIHGMYKQLNEF
jgi:hypothetical protein